MEKTITISLFNRVEYTKKVLEHLLRCHDVENYAIFIFAEPASLGVVDLAQKFASVHSNLPRGTGATRVKINDRRLGCSHNIYQCLHYAFDVAESKFNIHIEDDVVPARDFLQFHDWCNETYINDKDVFLSCGYQRTTPEEQHLNNKVKKHRWFNPWGWGTWKDRWDDNFGKELYRRINLPRYSSWDIHTNYLRGDRVQIMPVVARSQNIGAVGGLHVPSAKWHEKHQFNPNWIENTKQYTSRFEETGEIVEGVWDQNQLNNLKQE